MSRQRTTPPSQAQSLGCRGWIVLNSIDSALRDQVDDAPLRIRAALDVALRRRQARMTGQLLNIAQAAAALDASLGSLCDESAAPAMAGCALKPSSR